MAQCGPSCIVLAVCSILLAAATTLACVWLALRRRRLMQLSPSDLEHANFSEKKTPALIEKTFFTDISHLSNLPQVIVQSEAAFVHRYGSDPASRRVSFVSSPRPSTALSYPHERKLSVVPGSLEDYSTTIYHENHRNLALYQYFSSVVKYPHLSWPENCICIPAEVLESLDIEREKCSTAHRISPDNMRTITFTPNRLKSTCLHLALPIPNSIEVEHNVMYFVDVRVQRLSADSEIAIGLMTRPNVFNALPGIQSSADGISIGLTLEGMLNFNGTKSQYCDRIADGVIIRQCYRPHDGWLGYTIDGKSVGMAGWGVGVGRELWPCIGVRGQCMVTIVESGSYTSKSMRRP